MIEQEFKDYCNQVNEAFKNMATLINIYKQGNEDLNNIINGR